MNHFPTCFRILLAACWGNMTWVHSATNRCWRQNCWRPWLDVILVSQFRMSRAPIDQVSSLCARELRLPGLGTPGITTCSLDKIFIFVCLLLFYILTTSKVISAQVLTWHSAHSWQLYSAASLGKQTTSSITWYPTQSHYPDTQPDSPCPTLIMPSTRLGTDKDQF